MCLCADPSLQNSECQVPGCGVKLFEKLKRKVRICDTHRHALKIQMDGFEGRFCQQCSRVHNIERFDGSRRGCRSRLLRRVQKERCEQPCRGRLMCLCLTIQVVAIVSLPVKVYLRAAVTKQGSQAGEGDEEF